MSKPYSAICFEPETDAEETLVFQIREAIAESGKLELKPFGRRRSMDDSDKDFHT